MSTYICSDLHGQYDLFMQLLDKISFSENDIMYVLGDIIDRGPDSIKLLQEIISHPNIICLLGNHELMMMEAFSLGTNGIPDYDDIWLATQNGGNRTLNQFWRLSEDEKIDVVNYLKNLYLQYEIQMPNQTYLLSHSSFLKEEGTIRFADRTRKDVFRVVWYSPWRIFEREKEEYYKADGRVHIIGHVPIQAIDKDLSENPQAYIHPSGSIINIDCGCALLGKGALNPAGICCMDLEKYDRGEADCFCYVLKDRKSPESKETFSQKIQTASPDDLLCELLEKYSEFGNALDTSDEEAMANAEWYYTTVWSTIMEKLKQKK